MTDPDKTISDRLRGHGQGLIIGFPTEDINVQAVANGLQTLRAYFFRVVEIQELYYEYQQLGSFVSGETRQFDYLGDGGLGTGDDILRIGTDDFHVYHFGYAPQDPDLNVYEKVSPSPESNTALSRRGGFSGPQPGDTFGFFSSGRASSVYDPPATTERVSFRNDDDGEFLYWGFEAEDDITAQGATIYIVGAGYKLVPVTDTRTQDKMVKTVVSDRDDPELPTVLTQVGGLNEYNLGTETPSSWDDSFSRVIDYERQGQG